MNYNTRAELETIGKAGVFSCEEKFPDQSLYHKTRMLSSYWLSTKTTGPDIVENFQRDGFWESWITLWISNNVTPGSVCIDAGANYGYYTFFLAHHGCRVLAVEANPELIKYLNESVVLNGCGDRVKIFNKAITATSWDIVDLNINDNLIGSASIKKNFERSVKVETINISDLLLVEPHIDFIKMDIEGSEEIAWPGLKTILQKNPACKIVLEFTPGEYKNNGRDLFEEMNTQYNVQFIDGDGQAKPITGFDFFKKDINEFQMLCITNKQS